MTPNVHLHGSDLQSLLGDWVGGDGWERAEEKGVRAPYGVYHIASPQIRIDLMCTTFRQGSV